LESEFRFIDKIGIGSQATVDLYKSRPPLPTQQIDSDSNIKPLYDAKSYAVKTYLILKDEDGTC
jgi:hypothetical protein